jgi:threonine/homoserine/homoserine lactone efflux protein
VLPTGHLLAFTLLCLVLALVPGPNVLFVISRSLQLGRAGGVCTALGGQAGEFAQVAAVAFGIGSLVERSAAVFNVIKLAGAAYLVYLGVQAVRRRKSLTEALGATVTKKAPPRILWDGFLVGVTNPKVMVFFAAVLPQFVDRSAGHVPAQMLLLGAIFIALAVVTDGAWALIAGTARAWFGRSPRRLELIGGTGGLAMIGIGIGLAATGRKH